MKVIDLLASVRLFLSTNRLWITTTQLAGD